MLIMGCDFHPRFQQIAFLDTESGEYGKRRLAENPAACLLMTHPGVGPIVSLATC